MHPSARPTRLLRREYSDTNLSRALSSAIDCARAICITRRSIRQGPCRRSRQHLLFAILVLKWSEAPVSRAIAELDFVVRNFHAPWRDSKGDMRIQKRLRDGNNTRRPQEMPIQEICEEPLWL